MPAYGFVLLSIVFIFNQYGFLLNKFLFSFINFFFCTLASSQVWIQYEQDRPGLWPHGAANKHHVPELRNAILMISAGKENMLVKESIRGTVLYRVDSYCC